MNDDLPAGLVNCYARGAVVNGEQSFVNTVTVHAPHDIQTGQKFLYALSRTNIQTERIFTCTARAATTITFSGLPFSFTDKNYLVPLGADTGGVLQADGSYSKINWDGTTVVVTKDPTGSSAYTSAAVPIEPGGELGFWSAESELWAVSRQIGGRPQRVYVLSSSTGAALDPLWNAKGDLAVGTAPDTAVALSVGGTNGFVLTVDSAQATGLKWAAQTGGVAKDDSELHIAVSVFH